MKLIFAVLLVCIFNSVIATYDSELKEKVSMFEDDCFKKTIGDDAIGTLKIDRVKRSKTLPDDGSLDKFAICILQKYHVLNDDGYVNENVDNYDLISDDPKKGKQQALKCRMKTGNSVNETARNILNCFLQSDVHMLLAETRLKIRYWNPFMQTSPFMDSFGNRRKPWMPVPFYG